MERRQEQGLYPGDVNLETVRTWTLWQTEVERRIGAQFARREVRWRAWAYIRALLSPVERKNGWQVAEVNGETSPYGVQHLLGRAIGDADALRDDLCPYVVEPLRDPQAVLVSMRRDSSKKASIRRGWRANIVGPPAALTIVKSGCF